MASGNAATAAEQAPGSTSGNTGSAEPAPTPLPTGRYAAALTEYETGLARSPLGASTRDKYRRNVRGYLLWLELGECDGDPLTDPAARDWAVRDYRAHLKTTPGRRGGRRSPATLNNVLAALDDFHTRRGLGRASARREHVKRRRAPRSMNDRQALRYLRAAEARERTAAAEYSALRRARGVRDRLIAELPYHAGPRASEIAALDLADVRLSARKGRLYLRGKGADGGKDRDVPINAALRERVQAWLDVRPSWPGAAESPALLLAERGHRLSARTVYEVVHTIGAEAGLGPSDNGDPFGPHVARHTFARQMLRSGVDIVTVAELLGHESLDTTRLYTLPSEEELEAAVENTHTDH
ncbi:tyrosine-type recombinase/integrase [Amycolatopsis keratiniphila]|uniref:Integrase n=1 Tax=Amycolatopsis keratiniphila subsp. keratiniphila TaxID=227715 RepID=A0A1W2M245_9PSEU|nr:tyrosine-type recombinase/integrase [Amycolatopsis keratiniphila]ONF73969.1 hypothetical protein AVR91_0204360 [Amycolatopsis keratiniphila subsp. keratiniphila]